MKKIFLITLALVSIMAVAFSVHATNPISRDGYFNGVRLAGKVRIVDYNGDFRIRITNSFPDLDVKLVDMFPDKVGEWQIVDYGEDFTVEIVDYNEDFSVRFVSSFPGVSN